MLAILKSARPPRIARLACSASLVLAAVAGGCNTLTGADDLILDDPGAGGAAGTTSGHGTGASASTASGTPTTGGKGATSGATTSAATTSTASSSSTSTSGSTDPSQVCVDTINMYRATLGKPPLMRWNAEEACVGKEATTDEMQMSAHYSFINQHMCGSDAENECPGYSDDPLTPNSGLSTCLALMWAEKDQSFCAGCDTCDFPYQNCTNCVFDAPGMVCGHYLNMKSTVLTMVACGFSTVGWYAQDFQ